MRPQDRNLKYQNTYLKKCVLYDVTLCSLAQIYRPWGKNVLLASLE